MKFNLPVTYSTVLPSHKILHLFILGKKYSDVGRKYYTLQKEKYLDSSKRLKKQHKDVSEMLGFYSDNVRKRCETRKKFS